jgi:acrylyl-CoA reductase (NADPH)
LTIFLGVHSQMSDFQGILVRKIEGGTSATVERLARDDLPPGEVLIAVEFSSLNYKDALAVTGRARVIRKFPMVAGIDLAGEVIESATPAYLPGERVIVTGHGLGDDHWGGFAELARVPAAWITRLPHGMTTEQAMRLGTAGFTAMLSILALEEHGLSSQEEVVVTGAGGGVGGLSVALLAALEHRAVGVTGRAEDEEYFRGLGALRVLPRREIEKDADRPLASARWKAAIDTVGGRMLAGLLAAMAEGGVVAACGMAGGGDLHTTVYPFIIRGVTLAGIDSVRCPEDKRRNAWSRLARETPWEHLEPMFRTVSLAEVLKASQRLLDGDIRGRVVVKI